MPLGHRTNARKTFYKASFDTERPDGRDYDSMLEASVARDLDILLKSHQIKAVAPQVRFDLFGKNGARICTHIVDFLVTLNNGTQKVVEPKGEETGEWKLKRKLFLDNYPHIEYINYGKLIDLPRASKPLSPSDYNTNVAAVLHHLKAK
jgi:hypothetical protein